MKRPILILAALAFLILFSAPAFAQSLTGPVTTASKWSIAMPANVTTVQEALTFEMRINRDGTPLTALVNPTCVLSSPTDPFSQGAIICEANLTQSNVDALNIVGTYNFTAALFRADVGEGAAGPAIPFVLKSPPGAPRALRITR